MKKNNKGFVVSAVLYPLLVLFLALIMGLLAMTDTRKRILDKMKLEISDSIFDEATCSCDTILNKLNYLIKNGVGGGGGGSYTYNVLGLNVKTYEEPSSMPNIGNSIGDIAVISTTEMPENNYYVSTTPPKEPKEGTIWIVQDRTSNYYIESDYSKIGISYVMQYEDGIWNLKQSYVYQDGRWELLRFAALNGSDVDLSGSNLNAQTEWTYGYTGEYQMFQPVFSGYYQVELWGAQGGTYSSATGGLGAYTKGKIYLNAGEILYIYVGGQGQVLTGGWNGGGLGLSSGAGSAGGGGGATDVRLEIGSTNSTWDEFKSLKSRIMVAAGGGGGSVYNGDWYAKGAAGGGLIGYSGTAASNVNAGGTGGSQSFGGVGAFDGVTNLVTRGEFGKGGRYYGNYSQGGGGSGYFGGGGGAYLGASGGGGSSYISGHNGCNSLAEISTESSLELLGSRYHYTGEFFKDTEMIDGAGYNWIDGSRKIQVFQPNNAGTGTQTGQSGNGYAKIRLLTVEYQFPEELETEIKENDKEFHYDGAEYYQTFTAKEEGTYQIELWGAQGSYNRVNYVGGLGAYTSGKIYLKKNETLYLYVGTGNIGQNGGWNGGGQGYTYGAGGAGGGGGATDVRLVKTSGLSIWDEFESLKSRIMVAAGGGGGSVYNGDHHGTGGAGGGLEGYTASSTTTTASGLGGTQALAGYSFYSADAIAITMGNFGKGGRYYGNYSQSGGGGGYYGGGAGSFLGAAGGGGSSYISGHAGCETITEASVPLDIVMNGSSLHYSGYYFIDDVMIDGNGYKWTTKKETYVQMPTYDGKGVMVGNNGSGHAKIKFISNTTKTDAEIEKGLLAKDTYFTFEPNGNKYTVFTALQDGTYKVELWGASGQQYSGQSGGLGAYTSGNIYLKKGTTLYVYLGERKNDYYYKEGGWNGGGQGLSAAAGSAGGGGGATDIRLTPTSLTTSWNEFESLKSRIMVAAGGGGGAYYNGDHHGTGGAGGGLVGYSGSRSDAASGGRQGYGGTGSNDNDTTLAGFGYGGTYYGSWSEGGGGGGYFGGGGGAWAGAAGGGGSSYISGHNGCNSLTQSSTEKSLIFNGSPIHYSGYYFTDTTMVDGTGYSWKVLKEGNTKMPTHDADGLMTGNSGNGYAKITLVNTTPKASQTLTNEKNELNKEKHFSFTSYYQVFEAEKTGNYQVELWGAQGFGWINQGGLGAYTKGKIYLTAGTKLYVYVGDGGLIKSISGGNYIKGGWNGGGLGSSIGAGAGGGGGGSTDIRTISTTISSVWNESSSLKSRIMVAAGGGGGAHYNGSYYGTGGAGGGLTGYMGNGSNSGNKGNGTGGTQIDAGLSSYDATSTTATKGGFGFGGNHRGTWSEGGGGSGWYGGGAGGFVGGTGGGGSSYISGHEGCIGINSSGNPLASTYTKLADSLAWNGYKFTDTYMVDGEGYQWTTVKQPINYGMPTWDNSTTMTGNATEGHAKITYLGA